MRNINFVPDDYVQSGESRRTNLVCLVLLALVMTALGGSFVTIKVRQRACRAREELINTRMAKIRQSIKQFEELQMRRKAMMKTALTTAELLEPVPRSVVLASLTNNLPPGVSLLKLNLIQKMPKQSSAKPVATSKYKSAQAKSGAAEESKLSQEKSLETHIDIGGMAPSDLQVADYIERLSNSTLLENVALVESKEYKIEESTYRQFKLTAVLKNEVHLSAADVDLIRSGAEESIYRF
ncbi:MAG: PilN domain-containing protein [Sedimentisphaerales bacterium]|nr:PilN domain-containing protein [Sedimentisphaerales bacterium]